MQVLEPEDTLAAVVRQRAGGWGCVDKEDRLENESALKDGRRLLSVYEDRNGKTFWIITGTDRSLLPDNY